MHSNQENRLVPLVRHIGNRERMCLMRRRRNARTRQETAVSSAGRGGARRAHKCCPAVHFKPGRRAVRSITSFPTSSIRHSPACPPALLVLNHRSLAGGLIQSILQPRISRSSAHMAKQGHNQNCNRYQCKIAPPIKTLLVSWAMLCGRQSLHGEDDVRDQEELERHSPDEAERRDPQPGEAKNGN